jgi:alanyl-tRNA synthetase
MTHRLYYTDSYLDTFTARVEELSSDGLRVYLDRTAFYPTSGGQPHDTGTLGGRLVTDVVSEGERIAHHLAEPALSGLERGTEVEGRVDWPRRFDQMQQHTGQHLISAVALARFGWRTVSVHFGDESATLDLEAGRMPEGGLGEVERAVNEEITANRRLIVSFEEADSVTGLRRPSKRTGTLRVVTIEGLDRSACGGTHLAATGEIGVILLRRLDRVRGAMRLEFVCGGRAVRRARADFEALSRIAASLSASLDTAPDVVASQIRQLSEAISDRKRLRRSLADARAHALVDAAEPDAAGVRWVVLPGGNDFDLAELRDLSLAVATIPRAALVAALSDPPTLLVAAAADSGIDAGRSLRAALAEVGGRGGGSYTVAQGTAPTAAAVEAALASVLTAARSASSR